MALGVPAEMADLDQVLAEIRRGTDEILLEADLLEKLLQRAGKADLLLDRLHLLPDRGDLLQMLRAEVEIDVVERLVRQEREPLGRAAEQLQHRRVASISGLLEPIEDWFSSVAGLANFVAAVLDEFPKGLAKCRG